MRQTLKLTTFAIPLCMAVLSCAGSAENVKAGELYLLAGTYGGGSDTGLGSVLYRLNSANGGANGALVKVRDVVPRTVGTRFVEADYDRRILVVGSPGLNTDTFDVIKMDAPSEVVPSRRIPEFDSTKYFGFAHFLLDIPGRGLVQALQVASYEATQTMTSDNLVGVALEGEGGVALQFADLRHIRCNGSYGTSPPSDQVIDFYVKADGRAEHWDGSGYVDLDLKLQDPMAPDRTGTLVVNNDEIIVIVESSGPPASPRATRLRVFDRSAKTWRQVQPPFTDFSTRGFGGHWIGGLMAEPDSPHGYDGREPRQRHSPGAEARRAVTLRPYTGERYDTMTVDEYFESDPNYFPGELYLYNVRTGRTYQIHTGQGDSEVIYASDEAVYYRVNDSLYSAVVDGAVLAAPVRLVTDPLMVQIHHAFLSR